MSGITLPDEGWEYSVVDVSDNTTLIYTGRCLLRQMNVVVVLSAHTAVIEDTGTSVAGLAASAAVGTVYQCGDLLCKTGLTFTPNASGTGTVVVVFKPLHDTANASPGPNPK